MKIHFGHCNTTPSTELPIYFCAGIGPLRLGVVVVFIHFSFLMKLNKLSDAVGFFSLFGKRLLLDLMLRCG